MSSIDLNALNAEAQMAQQSNRKMCSISTDELISLLMRAKELENIQNLVPFKIGYCWPEDIHRMLKRETFRVGIQCKKGPKYRLEVRVQSLPEDRKDKELVLDLKALLEAEA